MFGYFFLVNVLIFHCVATHLGIYLIPVCAFSIYKQAFLGSRQTWLDFAWDT